MKTDIFSPVKRDCHWARGSRPAPREARKAIPVGIALRGPSYRFALLAIQLLQLVGLLLAGGLLLLWGLLEDVAGAASHGRR